MKLKKLKVFCSVFFIVIIVLFFILPKFKKYQGFEKKIQEFDQIIEIKERKKVLEKKGMKAEISTVRKALLSKNKKTRIYVKSYKGAVRAEIYTKNVKQVLLEVQESLRKKGIAVNKVNLGVLGKRVKLVFIF